MVNSILYSYNTGPEDIHGGNLKLILGLIWTLIKAYQIKFSGKGISTKKAMLTWVNSLIPEYDVTNFNTNWNDGRCLCGVMNYIRPGACPNHQALDPAKGLENCRLGMDLADRMLGIPKVMDPEDLNNPNVDELSLMTYMSYFCNPANALLLDWIQKKIPQNNIKNLSTDWNDGTNLGALGEACFSGLCPDWKDMVPTQAIENNKRLLGLMKDRLGLECPITPAGLADPKVDELIVATYLSQFRNAKLKASPEEFGLRVPNLPAGSALIKEPVIFQVDLTDQTANLKDDIQVSAHGPSSDVKVNLKEKGGNGLEACLIPTEAGCYDVVAVFQDQNIAGSPFTLFVADPSKCAIFGDIPSDMQIGQEETLTVKAREAGIAQLTCTFEDKDSATTKSGPVAMSEVKEQENQQYEVKLIPKKVGSTDVHLKWANVDIPRTPFPVNICDASKASVSGVPNEGKVGDPVVFQVKAAKDECGKGQLKVSPRGPSASYNTDVKKKDDGTYDVKFVPWEIGPHKVNVEYGGGAVPGSPFPMDITAALDAKSCSASGKGLKKAVAGEETSFQILSPEIGLLTKDPAGLEIAIQSLLDKASTDTTDNKDGSYTVKYTAPTPGSYDIRVKFYDKHIPGSPFTLNVVPSADASKCKAYGPALHPNSLHIAGNPLDMFVDTTQAGTGDLRVIITGPNDSKPKVYLANEDGTYSMKWDVPEPGRYHAHIWWAEQYIPGSPFKIKVSPGPNAAMIRAYGPGLAPSFEIGTDSSDFTIETKDAGIGTLTIRVHGVKNAFKIQARPASEENPRTLKASYHPTEAGDYIIAIRWSGAHIPGSPFKIGIKEPLNPEEEAFKVKKEKEKSKPLPPNIYMSYTGASEKQNDEEDDEEDDEGSNADDDVPEPTPLEKVKEKKKKKGKSSLKAQSHVRIVEDNEGRGESSTVSLPTNTKLKAQMSQEEIRQQQMEMLRQRGAVPGVVPGTILMSTAPRMTQVVHQQRAMKQVKTVTTTSGSDIAAHNGSGEKKKKKKKKF